MILPDVQTSVDPNPKKIHQIRLSSPIRGYNLTSRHATPPSLDSP